MTTHSPSSTSSSTGPPITISTPSRMLSRRRVSSSWSFTASWGSLPAASLSARRSPQVRALIPVIIRTAASRRSVTVPTPSAANSGRSDSATGSASPTTPTSMARSSRSVFEPKLE